MKKFSFSLEMVKRLRADTEQQAQAALGRSIAAHRAAQEARDARARSLEVAQSQLAQPSALAHELARAERERSAAELRFGAASVERRKAEDGVVHPRGELAEASRSLEILERLERKR